MWGRLCAVRVRFLQGAFHMPLDKNREIGIYAGAVLQFFQLAFVNCSNRRLVNVILVGESMHNAEMKTSFFVGIVLDGHSSFRSLRSLKKIEVKRSKIDRTRAFVRYCGHDFITHACLFPGASRLPFIPQNDYAFNDSPISTGQANDKM
jgi:hypothetical protein